MQELAFTKDAPGGPERGPVPRRLGERALAGAFLAVWPISIPLALVGTLSGLMWLPWWSATYAAPVLLWLAGGIWWWVRGPRTTWQRAVRGFAQGHVAACLFIEVVSVSGVLGHALLSHGWFPGTAGVGGIGGFYLLGFALGTVLVVPGPGIALAWALFGGRWPRIAEWVATAGIGAWTGALGLSALMLSA